MSEEEKKKQEAEAAKGKPMGDGLLSPSVTDYGTPQTYADKLRAAGIKPVGPNDSPQAKSEAPIVTVGKGIKNFVMGDNPWARKDREMAAIPGSPQFPQPTWATPSAPVAPSTAAAEATTPEVASAPEAAQPKIYAPDMMQRNMDMLKWRLAYGQNHGVDSRAAQNEYDRGMAGITNVQNVFRQHDEDKAARAAGVLARGNDGVDRTLPSDSKGNAIIPQAGSMSDGSGRVQGLYESSGGITRSERNLDGTTTYHPAGGGTVTMGKPRGGSVQPAQSVLNPQTVASNVLNYQDLSGVIPRGTPKGELIEGVPAKQFLENNANRIAKESGPMEGSINSNIQKEINARITATPDLTQALTELNRRGIIDRNTPASVIEKRIAEYNSTKEPSFGDLLTKLDAAAAKPGFNRVPVVVDRSAPSEPDENFTTGPANVTATPESVAQYNAGRDADAKAREVLASKSDNTFGLPTTKDFQAEVSKQAEAMRNSPTAQAEKARWDQYTAKNAMEAASAPRTNGNPLRGAQIDANIGKAAAGMAKANGVTDEQLKANPELAARFLPKSTGINALGSSLLTNDMAMQALRGTAMPELVNYAVGQNMGGSVTDLRQNERARKQAADVAGTANNVSNTETRADKLKIAEKAAENQAEEKADKKTAQAKDRIDRLRRQANDRLDKYKADTMRGGKTRDADMAAIEAELDRYNEEEKGILNPTAATAPVEAKTAEEVKAPKIGEVVDGHKFKGGDPADQKNWVKI
jgi:hypothetical protein